MRRRVRLTGVVQGVGFRPFVARLATELGVAGQVTNVAGAVEIDAEAPAVTLDRFQERLVADAPILARIDGVQVDQAAPTDTARGVGPAPTDTAPGVGPVQLNTAPVAWGTPGEFLIAPSRAGGAGAGTGAPLPPDVAACDRCLAEVADPSARRHRYPFTSCPDCGPRYVLARGVPYDRAATTLAGFTPCDDCAAEFADPADRRFHHQAICCAACGPRLRLVVGPDPGADPAAGADSAADADPAATPASEADPTAPAALVAGPAAAAGPSDGADPLVAAAELLGDGGILAVQGDGGLHLMVDATNADAVARLRARKARPHRPMAVLVADVAIAERLGVLDPAARTALASPARPIVVAERREPPAGASGEPPTAAAGEPPARASGVSPTGASVAAPAVAAGEPLAVASGVAPGVGSLGVMVAGAPLQHSLLAQVATAGEAPAVLVCTSANRSGEPICRDAQEAAARLAGVADAWLLHDRPLVVPCDDSVVRADGARVRPVRRSRGMVPVAIALARPVVPTLAVGGDLSTTVCVAAGQWAWMSQHLGDQGSLEARRAVETTIDWLLAQTGIQPQRVAVDAHPGYHSATLGRAWGTARSLPVVAVQHHLAHVAAAATDAGLPWPQPLVGVACDGTGYGTDGTMWGGEVLVVGPGDGPPDAVRRAAHLATVAMPGGDLTVREPARSALAHLRAAGLAWTDDLAPVAALAPDVRAVLARQLDVGVGCVGSSSLGRLFDAVASLLDVCHECTYQGQAAVELEALAAGAREAGRHDDPRTWGSAPPLAIGFDGVVLDPAPLLADLVATLRSGGDRGQLALAFHRAVADGLATAAGAVATRFGIDTVVLTGGVFHNVLVSDRLAARLGDAGCRVHQHRQVPPGDGGLALGQAVLVGSSRGATGPD